MSFLSSAFKLGFQISPIILTGGVATNIPGGMLPIVSITEAANFVTGLLSGGTETSLDDFFAHFQPAPGMTLVENAVGHYPFANQAIAANAIIAQPLRLSMLMICPVKSEGGYIAKLATMSALKAVLAQHGASGGLYTVATPSGILPNGILLTLRDISAGDTKQVQHTWQWDFEFPLVTLQQAEQAQNTLTSKLTNGLPTDGSLSGAGSTIGIPASGAAPSLIPAAQPLSGVLAPAGSPLAIQLNSTPGAFSSGGLNFGPTFTQ